MRDLGLGQTDAFAQPTLKVNVLFADPALTEAFTVLGSVYSFETLLGELGHGRSERRERLVPGQRHDIIRLLRAAAPFTWTRLGNRSSVRPVLVVACTAHRLEFANWAAHRALQRVPLQAYATPMLAGLANRQPLVENVPRNHAVVTG